MRRIGSVPGVTWLLVFALVAIELGAHYVSIARVPSMSDWRAAASFVRHEWRAGDLAVAAPGWADPLMREVLGSRMTLADGGRADLAPYHRLWALEIRGARPAEAPASDPELSRSFGRVRVERWRLPDEHVLAELVDRLPSAHVELVRGGAGSPCIRQRGYPTGGGIGAGPITPPDRFTCDPGRPWLWVGVTIIEDLQLVARRCVYQHPSGEDPIRVTFPDVPLGSSIVFYGDLYAEHERERQHGPIHARVLVDDVEVGHMTHEDGDGWKRLVASTRGRGPQGNVTIEVTAPDPNLRTFCWAASTRGTP